MSSRSSSLNASWVKRITGILLRHVLLLFLFLFLLLLLAVSTIENNAKEKLHQMDLTSKEDFIPEHCNLSQGYCHRGQRMNSTYWSKMQESLFVCLFLNTAMRPLKKYWKTLREGLVNVIRPCVFAKWELSKLDAYLCTETGRWESYISFFFKIKIF